MLDALYPENEIELDIARRINNATSIFAFLSKIGKYNYLNTNIKLGLSRINVLSFLKFVKTVCSYVGIA